MRRSISQRVERLEQHAGITRDPVPNIFVLFPESERKPGNAIDPRHRYGHDWKIQADETSDEYHTRISAQLMVEGENPPFIFLIFAYPPGLGRTR
jgi:hypothetical protein